ncbi:MAG: hypothetical protein NVSMB19_08250 [Vulcanimicrobiaceae bacterium]
MSLRSCAAFAVLVLALGAVPGRAAGTHVLRMADGQDVTTLNPLLATSANITTLSELTMAHFVRFDAHDRPVPELLTEIPSQRNGGISGDGRTLTFHLRHGVRWSDGVPFDADDVAYTFAAIANPANNVASRDAFDRIVSVAEPDKYTIVLRLKTPYAPFYYKFFSTWGLTCVLPKHVLGAATLFNDAPYNALPVGIGPFRYTAFRRGEAVEMEANPYYFRGRPKLQKIVYKIITDDNTLLAQLQTGEIDVWAAVSGIFVDRVRQLPGVRVTSVPTPFVSAIYFNTTRPNLTDARVRRALRLLTDRPYLVNNVYHNAGTIAESVVPAVDVDYDRTLPFSRYDPAAAERLLDAAGYVRGADGMRAKAGVPLAIELALPSGYPPSATAAELLRAAWQRSGIAVQTRSYSSNQYFAPASSGGILSLGKFDGALLSLPGGPLADESMDYGCDAVPPRGFNQMRYCNRALDAAMNAYVATYDLRERARLAKRIQATIDDDAPAIVLYQRAFVYAAAAAVSGFVPSTFGPFDDALGLDR